MTTPLEREHEIRHWMAVLESWSNYPDGTADWINYLLARVAQLEAALEEAKAGHVFVEEDSYYSCAAIGSEDEKVFEVRYEVGRANVKGCNCDATEHNARIDTALNTMPEIKP